MNLYDYQTGAFIRVLSDEETERYNRDGDDGTCCGGTGAVDGKPYGYDGTVYAH